MYPNRQSGIVKGLDLERMGQLNFMSPDLDVFGALRLGFEVANMAESAAVVFNAANEAAVDAFLKQRIGFGRIVELIERAVQAHDLRENLTLEELLEVDAWARRFVGDNLDSTALATDSHR